MLREEDCRAGDVSIPFLHALAESRLDDPTVQSFMGYIDRYCNSHHLMSPIQFSPDHPVEEVVR